MSEVSGDFEIHITASPDDASSLAAFAAERGVKFVHIVLDRGDIVSQPMLTLTGRGTLTDQVAAVRRWEQELAAAGIESCRSKIEAAPWNTGVPQKDAQAAREPAGRYFEHHVKVLLPGSGVAGALALTRVVTGHGARLSRNARRVRDDGVQERFVNQRCEGVGLVTARHRLEKLVGAIREAGFEVARSEQEYVVVDSRLSLDHGWFADARPAFQQARRPVPAPAGNESYPPTYHPLLERTVYQEAAFDPAMRQFPNAYRTGEPAFADEAAGHRWRAARRAAMTRLLTAISGTGWADSLVLRGSATMAAWIGEAARDPGDLDFVVTPATVSSQSQTARDLLDAIKSAAGGGPITESDIWTYERADGRRLAIPFQAPQAPDGHVQVDIVFGEHLPLPPEVLLLPGVDVPVLAATAPLSLAWKLLWLGTDGYPQGKDLYDAVLLAEHTTVDRDLVRSLLRLELGAEADTFTAESVLTWAVDWNNFRTEYPSVPGTAAEWKERLALALDRAWSVSP